jgi:hypothetical protein
MVELHVDAQEFAVVMGFTMSELLELRRVIETRGMGLLAFLQYVRDLETDHEATHG